MAYVHVTAKALENFLQMKKFTRKIVGKEVVYTFSHLRYQPVLVKVWTSLPADGGDARGSGQDAIRVTVAYEGEIPTLTRGHEGKIDFGIYKTKRIFRVGTEEAVLDRLHERMREAYQYATKWLRDHWTEIPHQHTVKFNDYVLWGKKVHHITVRSNLNFLPVKIAMPPVVAKSFNIVDLRIGHRTQLPVTKYNEDPLSHETPATVFTASKNGCPVKMDFCPKGNDISFSVRNMTENSCTFEAIITGYIEAQNFLIQGVA